MDIMEMMNEFFGIKPTVPIVVLCLVVGYAMKCYPKLDNKWIPLGVSIAGAILGIVGMLTMPEFAASDFMSAAANGVVSGLVSIGLYEAYKQGKKITIHKEEIDNGEA